ncbi:glycosyltransferase family 9 protein [Pseudonocardia bannensis]|uniref:glycosyltransferase family 9 protein n=1 Tax=Pseudonocardia bannensis TaxID=630973 RepID=UPI001B7D009B|nr:glycosyltransferase family 9 protein [Pseudonocardia bannensis]
MNLSALRRVLVVRADNIGDVVMLTPALRALRDALPRAGLDLLASPAGAGVRPLIPELDDVLPVSPTWQQLGGDLPAADASERERGLLELIRSRRYDAMLVFTSFSQSPWPVAHLGLLAGIGVRVVHSREFAGAVATHWVTPPPDTTHQVDRCLHLLAAIGVPDRGRALRLRVPGGAERLAEHLLAQVPGAIPGAPFALLVPGASCSARRYPADRFGAAAARITGAGLPVRVAGTTREAALVAEVVRTAGHPDVRALAPTTVPGFAALLRRAAVAVTNNSAGMHIADAVGTPVVVAYAGTERHGDMCPRTVPAALLAEPVRCSPCRQLTCPYGHECLDLPPERLATAALRLAAPHDTTPTGSAPEEDRWLPSSASSTRTPTTIPPHR